MTGLPFEYHGDPAAGPAIAAALHRVVDPEMSIDIVDLGLGYGVRHRPGRVDLRITMTSPACPVSEWIVAEIGAELRAALGSQTEVETDLVWEPPWDPERMSPRARSLMGWD